MTVPEPTPHDVLSDVFGYRAQKTVQAQLWFLLDLTVASLLRINGASGFEQWTALLKQRKQNQ